MDAPLPVKSNVAVSPSDEMRTAIGVPSSSFSTALVVSVGIARNASQHVRRSDSVGERAM